ncbi:hypothetical protein [Streptomyces sp. MUM 178J]|uniref:hypothetical protein n=1 Tax=Streptomyces sp. MUM 178J TaxID=2791991 RepID=UPI001F044B0C|nr:hypothetical protein [Streptomyces sp. MUM 178J]WRQ80419.1 hypothetical protein I3F59_014275 [Streptomyces sp. MUM 178J]
MCRTRRTAPRCPVCGWDGDGHNAAGGDRGQEHTAAWRWDLRAALLATRAHSPERGAAATPEGTLHPRLRTLLRRSHSVEDGHGDPSGPESPAAPAGDGGADTTPYGDLSGAVSLLTALAAGEVDAVCFFGVSPAGLAMEEVGRDDRGALGPRDDRAAFLDWRQAVPWLRHPAPERQFLLAGGIGADAPYGVRGVPGTSDTAWETPVRHAVHEGLQGLLAAREHGRDIPLVAVDAAPGWRWPRHALTLLDRCAPPSATLTLRPGDPRLHDDPRLHGDRRPLAGVVTAACRRVPLRYGYALLTRPPDQAAEGPAARARLLFPCGTRLPDSGELPVKVPLLASPDQDATLFALPVVVARGPHPRRWSVLRTAQTRLEPGRRTTVTVLLDASGAVRFEGPEPLADPGADVAFHFDERALLEQSPAPIPRPEPLSDLMVLLELGGEADDFARRTGFLQAVLNRLAAVWPHGDALRVGLIGYADHAFRTVGRNRTGEAPLLFWGSGTAREAAHALPGFSHCGVADDFGAPMEEALQAAGSTGYWRTGSRRALLVVGRRPPHPPRQGRDQTLPCPAGLDWEAHLHHLRQRLGLRVIAVRDPLPGLPGRPVRPPTGERIERFWEELGRQGRFTLDRHTPDDVAVCFTRSAGRRSAAAGLMTDVPDEEPGPSHTRYLTIDHGLTGGTAQPEGR